MNSAILKLEPCPKCRETEKLTPVLHPGTAYVECDACRYRGPEIVPTDDEKKGLVAVVNAWNNLAR